MSRLPNLSAVRDVMPFRSVKPLASNLERKVLAYVTAASAASLGIAGIASPAEGRVIYTPRHQEIFTGGNQFLSVDLNHDGVFDFFFGLEGSSNDYLSLSVEQRGSSLNGIQVGKSVSWYANARKRGGEIGPQKRFSRRLVMAERLESTSHQHYYLIGSWVNVKGRYVGLKFTINGKTHYGWARWNVHIDPGPVLSIHATLTGYAYETEPNKPIVAGDKGKVGNLGHLALGTTGRH
jgi:hypothetical protein